MRARCAGIKHTSAPFEAGRPGGAGWGLGGRTFATGNTFLSATHTQYGYHVENGCALIQRAPPL